MSGGLFNLFQMSQQEDDVLSLEDSGSECFDTAEAGSSADEMEDCLSAVSEGLAVAEVTGPPSCNNVAPVTNLFLGRATMRSHSSQWSKKKVAVET